MMPQALDVTKGTPRFARGTVLTSALAFLFTGALSILLSYLLSAPLIVWAPAGVAVALAVRGGRSAILGAALGSLVLGLAAQELLYGFSDSGFISSLVVACAVALRTAVSLWLLRRFRAFPFSAANITSVGLFFFFGAVLPGLMSAVISTAGSIGLGRLALSDAPLFAAVYWCSDALGIMICTPIIVFYQRSRTGERLRNAAPLIATGLLTLASVTGLLAYEQYSQWRRLETEVTDVAKQLTERIENTLRLGANAVGGLAGAFEGDREGDLRDFEAIARRVVAFGLGIQAIEWIPRVSFADLRSHQESMQKQWRQDYRVFERRDGQAVPVAERAEYFPVAYVYPLEANKGALGFDLASNPERKVALLAARESGKATATEAIRLVQNGQTGMLLFLPALKSSGAGASEKLQGFALGVFSIPRLLDVALKGLGDSDVDYWLIDQTDPRQTVTLAATGPGQPEAFRYDRLMPHHFVSQSPPFSARTEIEFAGRSWGLLLTPREAFIARRTSSHAFLIMTGGSLLSALMFGFVMVMTDRQREILEDQERALENQKLALDQHAIVSITDPGGRITYVNDHFCRVTGRSSDAFIGETHRLVRSGLHDDAFFGGLWSTILRGEIWRGEICNRNLDGEPFWVQTTITPVKDRAGRLSQFIAISTDITPIKRLEDSLRRSEQRLNIALSASSTGLWDFDPAGDEAFFSDAWYLMLGYVPGELPACRKTFVSLLHPEDRGRYVAAFAAHASGRTEIYESKFRMRRKNDEWAWIKSIGKAVERDASGTPIRVIGIHIDVTKEHEIQSKLAAAKASADHANEAKTNFLMTMSHEIRTPMNGILGLAELLEREALSADQLEMVRQIRQAGNSLLTLVNDVLDLSKIGSGHFQLDLQPLSLAAIFSHLEGLLGVTAQSKGLKLRIGELPQPEGVLIGDPHRLQQILMNLVGNAIKFTERGEVDVEVKLLRSAPQAVRLRFEVIDTGLGVSPRQAKRLFEPFTQADATITRRYGGTGLGLSICKRLVEMMGGEIGVESAPGKGSTFWFELPFERSFQDAPMAAPQPPRSQETEAPRLAGRRFLVVDDSRMNRDVVERMLSSEGARVVLAEDGEQALECLRASGETFDAVLMDVQMPVMDGLAATRRVRRQLRLTDLPVIALSAGVLDNQRQQVYEAGASDFLAKPVQLEALVATLNRWTSGPPRDASLSAEACDVRSADARPKLIEAAAQDDQDA